MDSYKPGSWLLYASLEVLFLVNIAEFLYPGYSVSQNYISDLGVRPEPHGILLRERELEKFVLARVPIQDLDCSSFRIEDA
jgi:hypothetical protein